MCTNRNIFKRIYKICISDWFMLMPLFCIIGLVVTGILLCSHIGSSVAPSMDTASLSKWAYVLGLPNHFVFWGIMICGGIYWLIMIFKMFARWKSKEKKKLYLREQFEYQSDLELSAHTIHKDLIKQGFHVQEQQSGEEISFTAEKHRINRWAGIIIHCGILIAIVGLSIYGFRGMREDIYLVSGAEEQIYSKPLIMNLHEIKFSYYPDTKQLRSFGAQLTITDIVTHELTAVNIIAGKPLLFDDAKYHVIDFGKTLKDALIEMHFKTYRERTRRFRLKFGRDERMLRSSLVMRLEKFMPDFVVIDGKVTTRSLEWNNPAVKVSVFSGRRLRFSQWLFDKYKDNLFFKKKRNLFVQLVELNEGKYLNMRMSRSPGILVVWSGIFLILTGTCLKYFLSYQVIWVLIKGKKRNSTVIIAGEAAPEHIHFPEYFKRIVNTLKNRYMQ